MHHYINPTQPYPVSEINVILHCCTQQTVGGEDKNHASGVKNYGTTKIQNSIYTAINISCVKTGNPVGLWRLTFNGLINRYNDFFV
jgi:hypothetical protein